MTSGMPSLLDSIFGKQNLEEISLEEIHSVINEFPSFNAAHFLLSKKLKLENDQAYLGETMKTALYFNNPVWLQSLLEEENEVPAARDNYLISDHESNLEKAQPAIAINEEYANEAPSISIFSQEFNEPQPAEAITEEYQETEPSINYQASTFSEYQEHDEAITESVVDHQASTPLPFGSGDGAVNEEYKEPEEAISINEKYEESRSAETINEEFAAPEETITVNEQYEEPQTAETINEEFAAPEETITVNEQYEEPLPAETINEEFAETESPINHQPSTINEEPLPAETINEEFAETESPFSHQPSTINEPHTPFDSKKAESIVFEPYHMIDYFASQGIRLTVEDHPTDQFGRQLKSFTDWLKVMKRLPAQAVAERTDDREAERIRRFAASSIEDRDILTETMAEVLAKQGMYENAIALYQKLSLIYPPKSAYFASRIEQLKASLS